MEITSHKLITQEATEKAHESVARIVEAAIECIAQNGYEGASTKEIAARAGVSKSLLHYHFQSKEEILIEAVTHMSRSLQAEVAERIRADTPSIERAMKAADALFQLLVLNPVRVQFIIEMWATANHNEKLRERLQQMESLQRQLVRETISSALGPLTGSLAIPLDRAVTLIQSIVAGFIVESRRVRTDGELRVMFEDVKQVLVRGAFALKPD